MPTDGLSAQVRLTNELRDSTALVEYATKLTAVPAPEITTMEGARRIERASVLLVEMCRVLGVFEGKVRAA